MGRNHARVYSLLEGATLAAVYDQDRSRAEAVVAEFGGQVAETLGDLAELCDAVSVVVPTEAHLTVGGELLERGVSVLVEKPIASTAEDAEALVRKAAETGRILQVGHIERFNPVLRELEKQLSHPKFHRSAPAVHRFPKRSMDIGVVLDLMIHDLEVILHLVSSPIASIDAVGVTVFDAARGHRECAVAVRERMCGEHHGESDQSGSDAEDPRISGRVLSLARLPGTGGEDLLP